MPVNELHRQVAGLALRAAARHGFALAGGNALLLYGLTSRETEDVDLFTDEEHGVAAAAARSRPPSATRATRPRGGT